MDFIITGISKSNISAIFKPITKRREAIITVKYPPRADAKILPVIAQIIPISVKTTDVPKMKNNSCMAVLTGVSFEHPPTYPMISGSMDNEQGDTDAIIPPKNAAEIIRKTDNRLKSAVENTFAKLLICQLSQIIIQYFGLH